METRDGGWRWRMEAGGISNRLLPKSVFSPDFVHLHISVSAVFVRCSGVTHCYDSSQEAAIFSDGNHFATRVVEKYNR